MNAVWLEMESTAAATPPSKLKIKSLATHVMTGLGASTFPWDTPAVGLERKSYLLDSIATFLFVLLLFWPFLEAASGP
jgi:hypothetical protein